MSIVDQEPFVVDKTSAKSCSSTPTTCLAPTRMASRSSN